MQQVNNMGSLLQSYALQSFLKKFGNEVSFLDIKPNEEDNKLMGGEQLVFKSDGEEKKKIKKINHYLIRRLINKVSWKKQIKEWELFRNNYLITDNDTYSDITIIGSDEVFNCMNSGNFGFTSQLFGNIDNTKQVITYAASCGATEYEMLNQKVRNIILQSFSKIDAFSVRDNNTIDFVSNCTDKIILKHLDPVLIYDFSKEIDEVNNPIHSTNYCVIYSYFNRMQSSDEIKTIKEFCKKRGLKAVALGAPQFWCDEFISCSPFQCLKIIKEATFVITDTFHGTIFSSKYASRFSIIVRESNRNKLNDLISTLRIQKHVLEGDQTLDKIYETKHDKSFINDLLLKERGRSLEYLSGYANK